MTKRFKFICCLNITGKEYTHVIESDYDSGDDLMEVVLKGVEVYVKTLGIPEGTDVQLINIVPLEK